MSSGRGNEGAGTPFGTNTGQRPTWLPEELYPFEDRYVEVQGCKVHYVDEGSGPVLLLLHGNPTYSSVYRRLIEGMRDRFRCIAPGYPGFGLSGAREGYSFRPAAHLKVIEEFVVALDLADVTKMVHDWGGPIGFGVALRQPERFKALVVGNTFAWPLNGISRFEVLSRSLGSPLGKFLIMRFNVFVIVGLRLATLQTGPPEQVMDSYRGPFARPSSRLPICVFAASLLRSRRHLSALHSNMAKLADMPALITWGDRDPTFLAGDRERFEGLFRRHRTEVLRGASHFIQEDAPGKLLASIREFVGEIHRA